jgi:hypothetical protein
VIAGAAIALVGGACFVLRMTRVTNPLVPPVLFRSRTFTVTNIETALLYAAIGVSFFLVAYQLQVGVGWSALRAGTALLPATVLMLVGSARSGALAERIGPRLQLTVVRCSRRAGSSCCLGSARARHGRATSSPAPSPSDSLRSRSWLRSQRR